MSVFCYDAGYYMVALSFCVAGGQTGLPLCDSMTPYAEVSDAVMTWEDTGYVSHEGCPDSLDTMFIECKGPDGSWCPLANCISQCESGDNGIWSASTRSYRLI